MPEMCCQDLFVTVDKKLLIWEQPCVRLCKNFKNHVCDILLNYK